MKKAWLLISLLSLLCICGCGKGTTTAPQKLSIEFQTIKANKAVVAEIPIEGIIDTATGCILEEPFLNLRFIGTSDKDAYFYAEVLDIGAAPIAKIYCLNMDTNVVTWIQLEDKRYTQAAYYIAKREQILAVETVAGTDLDRQTLVCYQMPTGKKEWEFEVSGAFCSPILQLEDGYAVSTATRNTSSSGSEVFWLSDDGKVMKKISQKDAQWIYLLFADENKLLFFRTSVHDFQPRQELVAADWSGKTISSKTCENYVFSPILLRESDSANYCLTGKGPIDDATNTFTGGSAIYIAEPGGSYYEAIDLVLPEREGCAIRSMTAQVMDDSYYLIGTYESIEAEILGTWPCTEQEFIIEFDEFFQVKNSWVCDIAGGELIYGIAVGSDGKKCALAAEQKKGGSGFNLYTYPLS